ncbi:MAG: T9SS type A sorting domain-containing protein, partial [Chitinophagaceae bacterium]
NNSAGIVTAQVNVTPLGNGSSTCNGNPVAFRYTIYPRPAVTPVTVPDYCRGVLTAPVTFGSATAGTSFAWTNSNATIGLVGRGTAGLPAFLAQNPNASAPNMATIIVTPTANKCSGTPYQFTFQVDDCTTQSGGTGSGSGNARMANQVTVGPNPTQNRVTVFYKGSDEGPFTVQLLTQYGQVLTKPVSFTGNTYTLDLTGMTAGVYVLQLVNPRTKETVQKQVIKL